MRSPLPLPVVSRRLGSQLGMGALSFLTLPSPSPATPWPPPCKFSGASQVSGLRFPYDLDSGLTTQTAGQADGWSLYLTLRRQESVGLAKSKISRFQVLSLDSSSSYPPPPLPSLIFIPRELKSLQSVLGKPCLEGRVQPELNRSWRVRSGIFGFRTQLSHPGALSRSSRCPGH